MGLLRRQQETGGRIYEVNEQQYGKLIAHKVRTPDKVVTVTVPEGHEEEHLVVNDRAAGGVGGS